MNIIKASTEKAKKVINRYGKGLLTLFVFLYPARDSRNFFGTERTENQQLV